MIFGMCEWRTDQSTRSKLQQEEAGGNARSLLPRKYSSLETHGKPLRKSFKAEETRQGAEYLHLLHLLNLSVGIYCQTCIHKVTTQQTDYLFLPPAFSCTGFMVKQAAPGTGKPVKRTSLLKARLLGN